MKYRSEVVRSAIKGKDWVLVTQVARDVENGVPSQLAADLLFWLADFLEPRAEPEGGYKYGGDARGVDRWGT